MIFRDYVLLLYLLRHIILKCHLIKILSPRLKYQLSLSSVSIRTVVNIGTRGFEFDYAYFILLYSV